MDFVTFKIAKKLKEKGFKEKCIAYYWEKINEHTPSFVVEDNMPEDGVCVLDLISEHNKAEWSPFIDAPTISQALKWLREEKKMHITVLFITDCSNDAGNNICEEWSFWSFSVINLNDGSTLYDYFETIECIEYQSYEEAALAGIEYALDLI